MTLAELNPTRVCGTSPATPLEISADPSRVKYLFVVQEYSLKSCREYP